MSTPRGFWSQRSREGQDDARLLLAEQVHALRHTSYSALRRQADEKARLEPVAGLSGEPFVRRTCIGHWGTGEDEELRILVQVYRAGRLGRLRPLAEQLLQAMPDGEMVGEYTLAAEGNDERRYVFPRRRRGAR